MMLNRLKTNFKDFQNCLYQEQDQWINWVPVALGFGIIFYFSLLNEPSKLKGLLTNFLLAGIWYLKRHSINLHLIFGFLFFVSLGFSSAQFRTSIVGTVMLKTAQSVQMIEGTIIKIEILPTGTRMTLNALKGNSILETLTSVRIIFKGKLAHIESTLNLGDRLCFRAALLPPGPPAFPGAYNFRQKAYFERISAVGYAVTSPKVLDNSIDSLGIKMANIRHLITKNLQSKLKGIEGGVAAALVTGDRAALSEKVRQAFSDSGLAHILAISGLHLSIASSLAFFSIRFCLLLLPYVNLYYPIKKWAAGAALIFTFGYLLISGLAIPAQRAFIMTSIVLIGIMVDREAMTLRNVSLAASFILLILPECLLSPSFQMSFAAVIALVSGYDILKNISLKWQNQDRSFIGKIFAYGIGISCSTLLATVATTPYIIYTFNRFTVHALAANLLAIPLLSFAIMPLLVSFLLLSTIGVEIYVTFLLKYCLSLLIVIAKHISQWPGSVILLRAFSPAALGCWTLSFLWIAFWKRSWRWIGCLGLVIIPCSLLFKSSPDLFVLPEKKLIGYQDNKGHAWVNSLRSGRYARESWLKMNAISTCKKFSTSFKKEEKLPFILTKKGYIIQNFNQDIFLELSENPWHCDVTHSLSHQKLQFTQQEKTNGCLIWITSKGFKVRTVAYEQGNRPWS